MPPDIIPARVTITFPDGTVTLLPRRAPVGNSGPIRGETLAVYLLGQQGAEAVLGQLTAVAGRILAHAPASVDAVEHSAVPALAVLGLTEAEAVAGGRQLGLGQILFWDGRRAFIVAWPPAAE